MTRTPCCEKAEVRKGPWMREEDELLVKAIKEHGEGNWSAIPKKAGLIRCGKSCRLRWANYLRPDLKRGAFSAEEEALIVRLHQEMGNRWAKIALELPGRTDNDIKNHWNTRIKKKLRESGVDPETHLPLGTRLADGMVLHTMKRPLPAAVATVTTPYPLPLSKRPCLQHETPAVPACAIPPAVAQVPPQSTFAAEGATVDDKAELVAAASGAQAQRRLGFRSSSCSSSDEDEGDSEGPSLVEHDGEIDAGSPTSVIVSQIRTRSRVTAAEAAVDLGMSARREIFKEGYSAVVSGSTIQNVQSSAIVSSSAQAGNPLSPASALAKSRSFRVPPPSLIIPCSASVDEGEAATAYQPAPAAFGGAVLASPFMLRNCLWDSSDLNCSWADLDMDSSATLPVLPSPKFIPLTPSSTAIGNYNFGITSNYTTNSSSYGYGYNSNSSSGMIGRHDNMNSSSNSLAAAADYNFPTIPTPPASAATADLTAFDTLPQPLSDSHLALHSSMDGSDCLRLDRGISRCAELGVAGVGSSTAAAGQLVPIALVSPPLPGVVPLPAHALDTLTLGLDVKVDVRGLEQGDIGERLVMEAGMVLSGEEGMALTEEGMALEDGMCLSPEEFDSFDLGLPPGVCPSPMPGLSGSIFSPAAATPSAAAAATAGGVAGAGAGAGVF